jgi:hypothetical protein
MQQHPRKRARAIAIARAENGAVLKAGIAALMITMTAACLYAASILNLF